MWMIRWNASYKNGERVPAQTHAETLNVAGKDGWEVVALVPPAVVRNATQAYAQFCLKQSLADQP
jgi:hypothetical protein